MNTNFIFLEDNIVCPICLEVFREPVTTACGHNFCMDCLQDYWDHQALIGECPYCPQCREPFNSRPQLRKNITLGEIAMRFTREDAQRSRRLAGPTDVPCDFCSPRKLKAIKSCLQCMAALCETHIRSHYEDNTFKNHQLIEPLSDLKANMCLKHRKLLELFCKMEGEFICQLCVREEHKNHEAVPLKEDRTRKEVSVLISHNPPHVTDLQLPTASDIVKTARDEVNRAFAEVMKEIKRLQTKVMDFIDQEERSALVGMGNSIQHRQNQLTDLQKQNLWLATLMDDPSDHQFLQVESSSSDHWITIACILWSYLQVPSISQRVYGFGMCFAFSGYFSPGLLLFNFTFSSSSCETDYCVLNFDANSANEELFLFKETHSVLNMGILLENYLKPSQGFNHWPQLLCTRSLCEGCHYWEAEISNAWLCLGVTYSYRHRTEKTCMLYLIGRNSNSWCLEWDSAKFSVWHNNVQTIVQGNYYKTIGVLLDYAAGSLTFYGITNTTNLIYRFLTTFTEPLYPAAMVSSGASITLKHTLYTSLTLHSLGTSFFPHSGVPVNVPPSQEVCRIALLHISVDCKNNTKKRRQSQASPITPTQAAVKQKLEEPLEEWCTVLYL
uniref:Uncharacterized protein n=1 Tax=Salvator merianae TaxID=96440 RepID=A0A8D0EEZ9_SALMN